MKQLFENEDNLIIFCRMLTRELNSIMEQEDATRIKQEWVEDIVKFYEKKG